MKRCSIDGHRHYARGWCKKHYEQWRTTGDPTPTLIYGDDVARFWSYVDASGDCWEWTGALSGGYGRLDVEAGRAVSAHRFAYEQLVGPIADFLTIDHLCRNRPCVNPDHLEPVTRAENTRREHLARTVR